MVNMSQKFPAIIQKNFVNPFTDLNPLLWLFCLRWRTQFQALGIPNPIAKGSRDLGLLDLLRGKDCVSIDFKNYRFEIFRSPGEWMDQKNLEAIRRRSVSITFESCGKHPRNGFYVDTNLLRNKIITICSRGDRDCAFGVMANIGKYGKRTIVHFGPYYSAVRDRGLMTLTFLFGGQYFLLRNRLKTVYFTSITHVPRVFGLLVECFSNVYPNKDPASLPSEAQADIRDMLMNSYVKEIEPEYKVWPGRDFILRAFRLQRDGSIVPYPHTAETVPKHRSEAYNKRCLQMIDYERGDAMIVVGEAGVRNYFTNLGRNFLRAVQKG
jgi:hypothetical protein